MDTLLYYLASGLIGLFQALPISGAARLGRFFGGLVYIVDARHRKVAIKNLTMCFGQEKSAEEIRALAKENFKRIGENFLSAIKSSSMTFEQVEERVEIIGAEKLLLSTHTKPTASIVVAIGHFGNFELFAQLARGLPLHRRATTYRALKSPAINRLLQRLRDRSGCLYFERRSDGAALRTALRTNNLVLGLLCDQHSGDHGVRLPFLGRDCNTTKAPAVFALRFDAPLHTAICYRIKLGYWRVEVGEVIPTRDKDGERRPLAAIMLEVNRAFEAAVRRDPANWFWVHKRWKASRLKSAFPKAGEAEEALEVPENDNADEKG
jgi:Kdo2-lipid IVA lauroyltransferase/acyltransferase